MDGWVDGWMELRHPALSTVTIKRHSHSHSHTKTTTTTSTNYYNYPLIKYLGYTYYKLLMGISGSW